MQKNKVYKKIDIPRFIVIIFAFILLILTFVMKMDSASLISDSLKRVGMNLLFTLAMMPGILCGVGLNFALPIGVICGALAGVITIQMNMTGFVGIFAAIALSLPIALAVGYLYGKLLTNMKGSEMMIGNYVNFSVISIMCIAWVYLPFSNDKILWPMGKGVRSTILIEENYAAIFDNFLAVKIGEKLAIPTGTFIFAGLVCLMVWLFFRSKTGIMVRSAGTNEVFAKSIGINSDKTKIIGVIMSTVLAAVGYVVFAQSYGFYQLYAAPMMMAYPAIASILIGGATPKKATMMHIVVGTFVYQFIMTLSLPVTSSLIDANNMSEILRMIISNGIILYALTKMDGGKI